MHRGKIRQSILQNFDKLEGIPYSAGRKERLLFMFLKPGVLIICGGG
jgi:hypothetical protein